MVLVGWRIIAITLALGSYGNAQAANLVVNGDFTMPGAGGGWLSQASIPGWASENGDSIEVGNAEVYGASCYASTCQVLEANANRFGSISQTVSGLATGASYKLGWAYAGRNGGGAQSLDVFVNGSKVAQNSSIGSFTGWQDNILRFTATAPTAKIMFNSNDIGGNQSYGNLVTNVSLAAVPEPATWAMLIIGFGMVGYASRRRAQIVAA